MVDRIPEWAMSEANKAMGVGDGKHMPSDWTQARDGVARALAATAARVEWEDRDACLLVVVAYYGMSAETGAARVENAIRALPLKYQEQS